MAKKMMEIVKRTWKDEKFKKALMEDPKGTLKSEYNIDLPDGKKINVIEDTKDTMTLVIPAKPELSDEDLDKLPAGGDSYVCTASGCE